MSDLTIEEIKKRFNADEVIDCGDVLVALRFTDDMSEDDIHEIRREIMKMKLEFELMDQEEENND